MSEEDLELLTTKQLIERINDELGFVYDRNTITAWTRREEDPLPIVYRGRPGQGHKYSWPMFLEWHERELARIASFSSPGGDLIQIDYHTARTIDMTERAKRGIIDTEIKAKRYGEVVEMEREAEDLGHQAVQMLLNISPRLAPQLATITDEIEIDKLLQDELRAVCDLIRGLADDGDGEGAAA